MNRTELECRGRVQLAPLSATTMLELAGFPGEWLEYSAEENALVVRHVQPGGSPALAAVPAELIAMLDLVPAAGRAASPGGTLVVHARTTPVLRLCVAGGRIDVQWPQEDWEHALPVELAEMFRTVAPASAKLTGEIAFAAPAGAERRLVEFLESFEGLYPGGEYHVRRDGETVRVRLDTFNAGPEELLALVRELASPAGSLDIELDVGSFEPQAFERDFRLAARGGEIHAVRPALWPAR